MTDFNKLPNWTELRGDLFWSRLCRNLLMHCGNGGKRLRNIPSTQPCSKECSKVVGFSLPELFTLHKVPPLQIASFLSPLSLSFCTKDFSKHTRTRTHTPSVRRGSRPERGSSVAPFQRALCLLSFWCLLPSSSGAEMPNVQLWYEFVPHSPHCSATLQLRSEKGLLNLR